ncbi:MAG: spore coat protein U domain-containing protein [Gammaproteobacteria bacterium]|nr:spore coat protein U domain-containing protein [Gammaproteobacteria bacterium]
MSRARPMNVGMRALHVALWWLAAASAEAAVTCTASAVGVAFGVYNPLAAAPDTSAGTIQVTCRSTNPGSTTINITAYYGTGSSGTYTMRTMRSGASVLNYNLYFDAAYTQIRGDGTNGTQVGQATLVLRRNQTGSASGTLYGRTPAGQDVAPGLYSDTITVTVTY